MHLKSFQEYLQTRLNKEEIAELEKQAELEYQALKAQQDDVLKIENLLYPDRID